MSVAHPTFALVALVTIGGNTEEVCDLGPPDEALKVVEDGLRGREPADGLDRSVNHTAQNGIKSGRAREARHFDKAEPVIGEMGFIRLVALTRQDVDLALLRLTEVLRVERTVWIYHLAKPKRHLRAGRAVHPEMSPATDVLSHVEYKNTRLGACHSDRRDRADRTDWRHHLCRQNAVPALKDLGGAPGRVVVACRIPSRRFETRIINFTVVDTVAQYRTAAGLPRAIADHACLAAIVKLDIQLQKKSWPRVVGLASQHARPQCGPATAEPHTDRVIAAVELPRNVIGRVQNALVKVSPRRV